MNTQNILACTFNQVLQRQPERLRDSLRPFQGKTLRFALERPSFELNLRVNERGGLDVASSEAESDALPDVSIRLVGGLPFPPPMSLEGLLASAHIAGNAEFAEALSFLLRNLTLNPGDFLHPVLGDVVTHRLEQALTCGGQHLLNTASVLVQKLSR